jgi:hypothetical protein
VTAALVGLLGITVGALLGGLVNYEVELRKRRATAKAAGLLISNELTIVLAKMSSAVKSGDWWQGALPTKAWDTHVHELALEVPDRVLSDLTAAYGSIARWNADSPIGSGSPEDDDRRGLPVTIPAAPPSVPAPPPPDPATPPPPPFDLGRLQKALEGIETAKGSVDQAVRWLVPLRVEQAARRWSMLIAAVAAVVALVLGVVALASAAVSEDVVANEQAVAAALRAELDPEMLVDCDARDDDWRCVVHELSEPRESCLAGAGGSSAAREPGGQRLAAAGQTPRCEIEPPVTYEADRDGNEVTFVPSAADLEEDENLSAIRGRLDSDRGLERFLRFITGASRE